MKTNFLRLVCSIALVSLDISVKVANCWITQDYYKIPLEEEVNKFNFGFVPERNCCGKKVHLTKLLEKIGVDRQKADGRAKLDDDVSYVWREEARVNLTFFTSTKSYSGFFTVDQQANSNLFFWFFPAAYEIDKAPLILWLNGGPGTSSLFGLFVENGPFKATEKGFLENRQYAWTLTHSVIYIDSPVGSGKTSFRLTMIKSTDFKGFSYTEEPFGYSVDQDDIANNLYEALEQFFRAFPEYVSKDLFLAGESYAGKYVPSLAMKIHNENKKKRTSKRMRLKGLIIGSGYFDPISQNEYGEFLFNMGLIDDRQMRTFKRREAKVKSFIENEEWLDATEAIESLIVGNSKSNSMFQNLTGYKSYNTVLKWEVPREFGNFVRFINKPEVRLGIHVGDQPFTRKQEVLENLQEDVSKSVKPVVEQLLSRHYPLLVYGSQMDIVVPHTGLQKFLNSLKWPGARQWAKSPRKSWYVNGQIAGFTKFARNLAFVLIRNAGHVAPYDQPLWTYDMVNRFTRGRAF